MNGYFKPLRRKIGVVTLGLACLAMSAWMRGFVVVDLFEPGTGEGTVKHTFTLSKEGLIWEKKEAITRFTEFVWRPGWESVPASSFAAQSANEIEGNVRWRWRWYGFDFCDSGNKDIRFIRWSFPYWSIVIPLTLLSAWLLLSRPRSRNSDPVPKPTVRPLAEYFRPLRRKFGVCTLLVACIFAAGWVRSCATFDLILRPYRKSNMAIISGGQNFRLMFVNGVSVRITKVQTGSKNANHIEATPMNDSKELPHWSAEPATHVTIKRTLDDRTDLTMIPYWSVVIPLFLLSAWLLLSRPREQKPVPPVAENA